MRFPLITEKNTVRFFKGKEERHRIAQRPLRCGVHRRIWKGGALGIRKQVLPSLRKCCARCLWTMSPRLESGEWIWGRGVADMKGGLAIHAALFEQYVKQGATEHWKEA